MWYNERKKEEICMGYVFISYSTKNQSLADSMRQLLCQNGIASWMAPADIPAGSKYAQVINRAIKECSCVLLMLSDASQNSTWVAKEIERAINYQKTIIPVQLEELVLNDEFEFYISTDQIVAVKQINENSPEINKILMSLKTICGNTTVSQQHLYEPDIAPNNKASDIQYRLSLRSDGGSLFIYSRESISKENAKGYSVTESEWEQITCVLAECIAFLHSTDPEFVAITLQDSLEDKKCAPLDGYSYYDKQFRINFGVSYITLKKSAIYDSAHIDVSNVMELSFFNKGSYIYHAIPVDSTLADIGLDEEICIKLSKKLIEVLHPNKKVVVGDKFDIKVYSDFSGGYKLHYLLK